MEITEDARSLGNMNGKLHVLGHPNSMCTLYNPVVDLICETRRSYAATLRDGQPRPHTIDRLDWNLAYKKTLVEPKGVYLESLSS